MFLELLSFFFFLLLQFRLHYHIITIITTTIMNVDICVHFKIRGYIYFLDKHLAANW